MYTWLNYYIPDSDSTFISSCISASISSYLDDETDEETVIGELRGSLINCVFLPEHRGSKIYPSSLKLSIIVCNASTVSLLVPLAKTTSYLSSPVVSLA